MASYKLKRKTFTQWDDTDNLKRMKDADILAEKKKQTYDYGSIAKTAAAGAAAGVGAGALWGGVKGAGNGSWLNKRGAGAMKGMKTGGAIGALLAGGYAYHKSKQRAKENEWYNKRLAYAQRQAKRREAKDWKTNMTQRDGYSY